LVAMNRAAPAGMVQKALASVAASSVNTPSMPAPSQTRRPARISSGPTSRRDGQSGP
jgi:hypothetical protein